MNRTARASLAAISLVLGGLSLTSGSQAQDPGVVNANVGAVRINGVSTPVYFNDGDTFRALAGPTRQTPHRLGGFNTLESYGPVHKWGGWDYRELYVNAKQATINARQGFWSCDVDPNERDTYNRVLATCPDLQIDQVRKGLAHALSIDGPSPRYLIDAQREAIVNRAGFWAKGVPPLVLTSLHSADERFDNSGNYNRLVSPLDGYSTKWKHQDLYSECQEVCHPAKRVEPTAALRVIAALRDDPDTKDIVAGYEDPYLMALLNEYVTVDRVARVFDEFGHFDVKLKLDQLKAQGLFGQLQDTNEACMVYVVFERRYRFPPKPECLKW